MPKLVVTDRYYHDLVLLPGLPRARLIFAGVSGEKCFVHYEQGGRGRMPLLTLFDLASATGVKPLWQDHCSGPPRTSVTWAQNDGNCGFPRHEDSL